MSKHTPGLWHVSELDASGNTSEYYLFIEPGVAVIERKVAGQDEHDMHDARLIAAAPDLLAVLQELEESARYWGEYDVPLGIVDRISAAIAKATGEKA